MISPVQSIPTAPPTTAAKPSISADFETFLTMLTTQIRNQDPLNPMQASDFAAQLATFSNVEQSVRTNQLLEGMQGQFGLLAMSQMASWVGQEARSATPVQWEGRPVTLSPNPAALADRAVLVVRDAQGQVLAREDIPPQAETYLWHGRDVTGSPLPPGRYGLEVESYSGEDMLRSDPVEHYARIEEVRGGTSGTTLVLRGGIEVPALQITALRPGWQG